MARKKERYQETHDVTYEAAGVLYRGTWQYTATGFTVHYGARSEPSSSKYPEMLAPVILRQMVEHEQATRIQK